MSGTQRLAHLLALADQGPAMRAALAEEVAELLADWPADCPAAMRAPCEALLERTVREVDDETRERLRRRLEDAPASAVHVSSHENLGRVLVEAARSGEEVASLLSRTLGLSESDVLGVLCDESGQALAAAAKALGLTRAAFSSLVLLSCPIGDSDINARRLNAFDRISTEEAARALRHWQGKAPVPA
ncbi:MAG TPA: hypothetical protein VG501_10895 [Rhizomicrobium sp.]|nr:hypothetical protein [Rhizomicrobium sp.]